jgi:uncharacterized membrane protein (DUF2068 family)
MHWHFHQDDQGFGPVATLLKSIAIEEMGHVERLAERTLFLKGDAEMALSGKSCSAHFVTPSIAPQNETLQAAAPRPHPPVALRSIAILEIVKGLLALAFALGLLSLRHTDLHSAVDSFLLRHNIDPETHYRRMVIESVAKQTHQHGGQVVALALLYAVVRFAEGYGLWRAKRWAEWFAVLSAGIYLPFEFNHFWRHPRVFTGGVILLNLLVIGYLGLLLVQQRARHKVRKHHL